VVLAVGAAVEYVRSKLARGDTGHPWSSEEIALACHRVAKHAPSNGECEISPRKRPFSSANREWAGKAFRERETGKRLFTQPELRIVEQVLGVGADFFDTAFTSYEEIAAAYQNSKLFIRGTVRASRGSARGQIGTDCLFHYEVRPAEKDDVVSIFQLSAEFFSREVLIKEKAVSGWVSQGHYRVIVENAQSASSSAVIGYYGIWPVSQGVYDSIRGRPGREKELAPQMGCRLDSNELYGLYIVDVVGPKDRVLATALCFDLVLYVNLLCGRHRRIERVGAWSYSSEPGRKICTQLGLKALGAKSRFYEIESKRIVNKELPPTAQHILRRSFQERYSLL